jgi:hypothetical protein
MDNPKNQKSLMSSGTLLCGGLIAKGKRDEDNVSSIVPCHKRHPPRCPKFSGRKRLTAPKMILRKDLFGSVLYPHSPRIAQRASLTFSI